MKKVLTFIFGERAKGVLIQQPTLRTTYPMQRDVLSESEWTQLVKFGSRYGHRGSFYENKPNVIKLVM